MANVDDRRQVQDRNRRDRARVSQDRREIQELMKLPLFRSFMVRLLEQTGVDRIIGAPPNAMALARDVALQDMGRWLVQEIRTSAPELELTMRREAAAYAQQLIDDEEADNANHESR